MRPLELDTRRLILRQWRPTDRGPFAALNADARVMEFFPAPLDRAASDAFAERLAALIAERGWGFWAVERKDSREFIGFVGLQEAPPALPFSPAIEIGWRLAYRHWGKGFATEAARRALRVAFQVLGVPEVVAYTAVPNLRSQAVMERLGMARQPATFEHPAVPAGSPLREHCLYRLSLEDWEAARRA